MQVCHYFYSNIPPFGRASSAPSIGWGVLLNRVGVFDMTKLSKVT